MSLTGHMAFAWGKAKMEDRIFTASVWLMTDDLRGWKRESRVRRDFAELGIFDDFTEEMPEIKKTIGASCIIKNVDVEN